IHSSAVGKGLGLLHEVRGQSKILSTVTKWNGRASRPEEIPVLVRQAFHQLKSGTPQPVGIEISHDLLSTTADMPLVDPADATGADRLPVAEIERAAELLSSCNFPVLYVGGGVIASGASRELQALAEKLQMPVVISENGKGAISDRHPLAFNTLEGRDLFP